MEQGLLASRFPGDELLDRATGTWPAQGRASSQRDLPRGGAAVGGLVSMLAACFTVRGQVELHEAATRLWVGESVGVFG